MKKLYIGLIIGLFLIGIVGAGTILNKDVSINKDLYDYESGISKTVPQTFTFAEYIMPSGIIQACVYVNDKSIGCRMTANETGSISQTEKQIIESYVSNLKNPVSNIPTKVDTGTIIIKSNGVTSE